MAEEKKKVGEEGDEENKFLTIVKYIFIGLLILVGIGIVSWSSLKFGVEPTFELLGGGIAILFTILVASQKFQDKMKFAKGTLLFVGLAIILNILYLIALWIGEKVYATALIATRLGGDEGARFAFILVMAFEVVTLRLAASSFLKVRSFRGSIHTKFSRYLFMAMHGVVFFALFVEAISLPIVMVTQWPLSNWQIVVTCLSCPVAWYLVYAVWGKKYL